ncbi:endonuclease/exonuclease/phosphatase family protein [Aliifodinibius salipaludis]|uniref:endonuclease/exonuclease/phosphatase family protein n=1 Tax=Fodinibius salipaludis TaxID=2032627 RepID=UPI0015952982|nr:endonuclease/exonuclease/phosphatase family protein [Aliifodinibius salipaludis]
MSAFSEVIAQDTLKVITYNIFNAQHPDNRGESTLADIADFISDEGPDFVALQEVDSATHRLATLNGGRYFSLADSLAERTGMHANFGKALDFDGGGYGIAILSRKPMSTQKVTLPNPKGGEPRVLLTANFDTDSGKKLILATTHFDHQHKENRQQQVDAVNELLLQKNKPPVILAGDFNFEPDLEAYQIMQKYWVDTAIEGAGAPAFTYPTNDPSRRIDYVFVTPSQRWEILSQEPPKLPYSDHLPVVTRLVLH